MLLYNKYDKLVKINKQTAKTYNSHCCLVQFVKK